MAYSDADLMLAVDKLKQTYGDYMTHEKRVQVATQILKGQRTWTSVDADIARSRRTEDANAATPASPSSPTSSANDAEAAQLVAEYANQLRQDGLEALIPYIDDWQRDDLTWPEILARLDDPATVEGRVIDSLYPERRRIRQLGGTVPTISQIRFYRDTGAQIFRQRGFPAYYYDDPLDFTDWIVGGVDLQELAQRADMAVDWSMKANSETKDQLQQLYNVDDAGVAAYVLDRTRAIPALQQQFAAAGVSAAAVRGNFGGLTASEAERLVSLGITEQVAEERFGSLYHDRELLDRIPGELGGKRFSREEQLGAVAGDQEVLDKLAKQAGRRAAVGKGGGRIAEGRTGLALRGS